MSDPLLYSLLSRLYQASIVIPLNSKKKKMLMPKDFDVMQNSTQQAFGKFSLVCAFSGECRLQTQATLLKYSS